MIKLLLIQCVFLLTGCGTWKWVNNYKPPNTLHKDICKCEAKAAKVFPLNVVQQTRQNYFAILHNQRIKEKQKEQIVQTSGTCNKFGDMYSYESTSKIYPSYSNEQLLPETFTVYKDINEESRDNYFMNCMAAEGWFLRFFSY